MLRSANELTGHLLIATDGEIGRCHDFLFEERKWAIRYMVAGTTKWLPGRKVVISPVFIGEPWWDEKHIQVNLSRRQIKDSPPLAEHAPVSRWYEINYYRYYAVPFYWTGHDLWSNYPHPAQMVRPARDVPDLVLDDAGAKTEHLRSTNELTGYSVATTDDETGRVADLLLDENTWAIRYLLVDNSAWLFGQKTLIAPQWLSSVDWIQRKMRVDLDSEMIKSSPRFDFKQAIDRGREAGLYDYYGKPPYWK